MAHLTLKQCASRAMRKPAERYQHPESRTALLARARNLHSVPKINRNFIQKPIFVYLEEPKCSRLHHQTLGAYREAGLEKSMQLRDSLRQF